MSEPATIPRSSQTEWLTLLRLAISRGCNTAVLLKHLLPKYLSLIMLTKLQQHPLKTCTAFLSGQQCFDYLVASMIISVLVGVTRTSTPEYPSSASSRVRNSFSSALKMPSATNYGTNRPRLCKFFIPPKKTKEFDILSLGLSCSLTVSLSQQRKQKWGWNKSILKLPEINHLQ